MIIRMNEVINKIGLSRATIYNRIKDGLFPPSVSIGGNSVGWVDSEVTAVINALIAGKDGNDIRELVSTLVKARGNNAICF